MSLTPPQYDAYHPTHTPSLDAAASDATTSVAPAVQPGRAGFVPADKAPESSALPPAPHVAEPVRDAERDGPLFAPVGEAERAAEGREEGVRHEREHEGGEVTRVVVDQPVAPPQFDADEAGEGVAIPAAAEGTSALPVQAIVQAEEAGGGKAAGHAAIEEEEREKGKEERSGERDDEADIALDEVEEDDEVAAEDAAVDDIADEQ